MSDDNFIPFNQSTPKHGGAGGWQRRNNNTGYNNRPQNGQTWQNNGQKRWSNYSKRNNSSFGSDWSNNSQKQAEADINAYLHPAMLQDPWAQLRISK